MNAIAQPSPASLSGSKLDNRRMLAALIDLAVVGAGAAAIVAVAGSVGAPLAAVIAGWALYYYFACESGGGQTLGKKLLGLRVVTVDGRAPEMRDVAVRTVLRLIDTALVGLVSMLATGERRARLGDLAAGTMIVSAEAAPKPAATAAVAAPAAAAPVAGESAGTAEPETVSETDPTPYRPVLGEGFDHDPAEDEPAEDEPVAEEPALSEPLAEEPVVELAASETAPAVESAAFESAAVEPVSEEPDAEEPVAEESAPSEPVVDEPVAEELSPSEPVVDEPVVEVADPVADEPVADEADGGESASAQAAAVDPASAPVELSVVEPPAVELSVVEASPDVEPASENPVADVEPGAEAHSLDFASPSLKELARDVQAAKGAEPAAEDADEPVVQVEVAGPEVDVDGPDMTVRSVETVSAIDLIMGADEPAEDPPADEQPPATA